MGLNAAQAGLLTTLPVLCTGLFAPLAPVLARRFGSERVILGILVTLALGILVRSTFGAIGVFLGSLMAGASIGIIGVLLPGIVKRDFPQHAGTLTGVYTMALCLAPPWRRVPRCPRPAFLRQLGAGAGFLGAAGRAGHAGMAASSPPGPWSTQGGLSRAWALA